MIIGLEVAQNLSLFGVIPNNKKLMHQFDKDERIGKKDSEEKSVGSEKPFYGTDLQDGDEFQ
jgi:hypothetical protein